MLIPKRDLSAIKFIKAVLLSCIVFGAVSQLYFAAIRSSDNLDMLNSWTRQPAEIDSFGLDNEVEVIAAAEFVEAIANRPEPKYCVAREEGTACLLLIADPFASLSAFDQVALLQNPLQTDQLVIFTESGFWLPVAINGLLLLLLGAAGYWLMRYSSWGQDLTWQNGQWLATGQSSQRVGFGSVDAELITETSSSRKAVTFWLIFIVLVAATLIPAFQSETADNVSLWVYLAAALGVGALIVYTFAKTTSMIIYQDQQGMVESSVFGIKRIPWAAVATVKLVNFNKEAQRLYDRRHDFSDDRPDTLNVYQVMDSSGKTIIRLSESMSPASAFNALLSRLRRQQSSNAAEQSLIESSDDALQQLFSEPIRDEADFEARSMRAMGLSMGQRKSLFHRDHRGTLISLILMLAPFVLPTGYLAYRSAWFQYAAEHTEGTIIEIKQDGVPSLIVEYQTPQGGKLTTHSDGSAAYEGYQVGDKLTVFYDADDPENARLDLFLELWLGTLLMGGLSGIVLLLALLIGKGLTAPMPSPMR